MAWYLFHLLPIPFVLIVRFIGLYGFILFCLCLRKDPKIANKKIKSIETHGNQRHKTSETHSFALK